MSVTTSSPLSTRVQKMAESETLKMAQMARELKAKGHDVISLSIGEPDFDTPDHIKYAAIKAIMDGQTKYSPVSGTPDLKEAICQKFKKENNIDFAPANIVVSTGAKQAIMNLCLALLNEGDECIILAPYWVSYSEMVRFAGGTPVLVSAGIDKDFKVTAKQVEKAITPRTKMLLFSSPCNPTGSVFSKKELESIANVIAKHENIYIVADEIYEYINFVGKHVSIGSFANVKDRTITVNGFSKGFAMTGWRLGYIGAPKAIAAACDKIQGQFTSGTVTFNQKAGAFALAASKETCVAMCAAFKERRELVLGLLREIPGFKVNNPEGAFYVFPDISAYFGKSVNGTVIKNSDDFCDYIMNTCYVGIVSGSAFGAPDCFRLSYAASEKQLREAIRRIKETVATLQ
jgi:aspartate aminotransferase